MRKFRVTAAFIVASVLSACSSGSSVDSSEMRAGNDDSQTVGHDLGNELGERRGGRNESSNLFFRSDFAELERIGAFYRVSSQRTSSGTSKLSLFYDGIADDALGHDKNRHDLWRKDFERFDEWIGRYPDSATPYIARAAALMGRAWQVRGGGYAGNIERVHVDKFQELAAEAGEYLMQHSRLRFEDPHWYALMMDVYLALGIAKDTFWEIYTEGLERYPDYDPVILTAANYYLPRWHGSLDDIEKLARYTSEQTESTRDFAPYARIYWVAGYVRQAGKYAFKMPPADWSDMVRGMDAVIERYPSQWNINHFGFFACYAGDSEAATRYIKLVEEPVFEKAWLSKEYYQGCRRSLRLSPTSNDL